MLYGRSQQIVSLESHSWGHPLSGLVAALFI